MMLVYVYIGHKVSAILVIPSLSTLSLLHLLNSNTTFAQMSSRAQSAEPSEVWESPKYYIRGDDVQSTLYQASKALEMLDCDYHLGPQITVPGEGSQGVDCPNTQHDLSASARSFPDFVLFKL